MILEVQYVELSTFVTVILALFSLLIAGFSMMLLKIGSVKESIATVSQQNEGDRSDIEDIWDTIKENTIRMDTMDKQRNSDTIEMIGVINKLNITLTKVEGTLENINNTIGRVEQKQDDQDKAIIELKNKK